MKAFTMNLSHEYRLLLASVQSGTPEEMANNLRDFSMSELNWDEVSALAFWQGVGALLYLRLIESGYGSAVPDHVMEKLRGEYFRNVARNNYLYKELNNILTAFQKEPVDVILLKGLALVKTVYNDMGARHIGDIDLLVKSEDLSHAENIMSKLGYIHPEGKTREWSIEKVHHLNYIHPEKNIPVEIHWHISHKSHQGQVFINSDEIIKQFWKRARVVPMVDGEVKVLSPEDVLIHLSHHFIKHRFFSPEWGYQLYFISKGSFIQLYDIARVLTQYDKNIDLEGLGHNAKEHGLENILYTVFYLLLEIMDFNQALQSQIHDMIPGQFKGDIVKIMIKKIFIREDSFPAVNRFLAQSFGENTLKSGIINILKVMFPKPEVISKRYSVPLISRKIYLYYILRPFDVIFRHRKNISEMNRIREDALLYKWVYGKDHISDKNK